MYDVIVCRYPGYSTRCHGDDFGFRTNVTSLSSSGIDRAGNEEMASAGSRPTLAVLPVVSPVRRQSHGDVRDHVTANTNEIKSHVWSDRLMGKDNRPTLTVQRRRHYQQLQQHDGASGRRQSIWNQFEMVSRSRNNRRTSINSDSCHSVELMSPWRIPSTLSSSVPASAAAAAAAASHTRVTAGRCAERRRAATGRERRRLRRLNAAFDVLRQRTCRHVIDHSVTPRHRLSKLDVLRRTISYIEHLEHLLHVTRARSLQKTVNEVSNGHVVD